MVDNILIPLVVSIMGGLAGLAALIKVYIDARAQRPDIAEAYEKMATRQAEKLITMQTRIEDLDCEIQELHKTIAEWEAGISLLINQLIVNGITPVWKPKERRKEKRNE